MSMKRIILIIVLVAVALGGWYAINEYTRTNPDLREAKPDITTTVGALIADFENDSAAASRKYIDKIIAVSGSIKTIDANGNPVVVSLGDAGQMSSVQCSMDSTYANAYANLREGATVTLKGICTGGKTEAPFGTDVELSRCVVLDK